MFRNLALYTHHILVQYSTIQEDYELSLQK